MSSKQLSGKWVSWSHTVVAYSSSLSGLLWRMDSILTEIRCIFGRFDSGDVGAQAFQQRVSLHSVLNVSIGTCIFIKL